MQTRRERRVWDDLPLRDAAWYTLSARCPHEFRVVWDAAVAKARRDGVTHSVPEVEAFMVIEVLAAEYLAAP